MDQKDTTAGSEGTPASSADDLPPVDRVVRLNTQDLYDALPARARPARGEIPDFVVGTRQQIDLVVQKLMSAGLSRVEYGFVIALYGAPGRFGEYAPFSAKLIERELRGLDWRGLMNAGLVEVQHFDRFKGKSRSFRIAPGFLRELVEVGPTVERVYEHGLHNLVSRRPTRRRVKSDRVTKSGNALPKLVRAAIDAPRAVPFNARAVSAHVERLRLAADSASEGSGRERALARYMNDMRCLQAVLAQGAEPIERYALDGLWTYEPAYRIASTGRVTAKGGALQSCSRAMKVAAYVGVPELRNYDLRASQARILIQFLCEAGIDAGWIERYGADPEAKHVAAAYVRVPVEVWKEALYTLLMGARTPSVRQAARSKGAVVEAIRRGAEPGTFEQTYTRFLDYTADLRVSLSAWHEWLATDFVEGTATRNNVIGKRFVANEVGAKVAVEDLGAGRAWRLKARLAAFLLQGREAAFTHSLAASSLEYGFSVLSNEHDGLVVQGEIPPAAVEAAAAAARMPMELVDLVEKPFL